MMKHEQVTFASPSKTALEKAKRKMKTRKAIAKLFA